jgi:hypothetical protein
MYALRRAVQAVARSSVSAQRRGYAAKPTCAHDPSKPYHKSPLPLEAAGGLLEYSVVYTDRAMNHMSAPFCKVRVQLHTLTRARHLLPPRTRVVLYWGVDLLPHVFLAFSFGFFLLSKLSFMEGGGGVGGRSDNPIVVRCASFGVRRRKKTRWEGEKAFAHLISRVMHGCCAPREPRMYAALLL